MWYFWTKQSNIIHPSSIEVKKEGMKDDVTCFCFQTSQIGIRLDILTWLSTHYIIFSKKVEANAYFFINIDELIKVFHRYINDFVIFLTEFSCFQGLRIVGGWKDLIFQIIPLLLKWIFAFSHLNHYFHQHYHSDLRIKMTFFEWVMMSLCEVEKY